MDNELEHHFRGPTKMVALRSVVTLNLDELLISPDPPVSQVKSGPDSDSDLASAQRSCILHRVIHRLPDPRDVAARKALAAMPPAPLERVLAQAEASRKFIAEWRAKGLLDLPDILRHPTLR